MATLQELIREVKDPALQKAIAEAVEELEQNKKFGLVFEGHLPDHTPLYGVPIKEGSLVAQKFVVQKKTKSGAKQEEESKTKNHIYTVLQINGDDATCEYVNDDGEKDQEIFSLKKLVAVARFNEPIYPYLQQIDSVCNAPKSGLWHALIEADNYHALQLLKYIYESKVDCIYIDPPYNTGASKWKYNNNYVDENDFYRHSKWLSMMEKRLKLAEELLNPEDSVLIVTIDEKEYLHLGCLLEQMFPKARMQMVSTLINPKGVSVQKGFRRADEYIFFVMFGDAAPAKLPLGTEWAPSAIKSAATTSNKKQKPGWTSMMRRGSDSLRSDVPTLYYAIYADPRSKPPRIVKVGEMIPKRKKRDEEIKGLVQILPIRTNGKLGRWQVSPEELRTRIKQGRVRLGRKTKYGFVVNYLPDGEYEKIEKGFFTVTGRKVDGSLIATKSDSEAEELQIAPTQWKLASHNASEHGSTFLSNVLGEKKFDFPKSLYAVHDTIRFFVANKPNALVVDFFAGSGTTLHAVNLLNAEDGGNRRCIIVTNNEVSESKADELAGKGYLPGDPEWEKFGIARHVTWPRTACSIMGKDVNGQLLKENYGVKIDAYEKIDIQVLPAETGKPTKMTVYDKVEKQLYPKLAKIKQADGLEANAIYFKLGFLDKTSVALGKQFAALLSILWMKAGAIGECPALSATSLPRMLIYPENHFAVLLKESAYSEFVPKLTKHPEIQTIYFVTDSSIAYEAMAGRFWDAHKSTYQLYKNYLENFKINVKKTSWR